MSCEDSSSSQHTLSSTFSQKWKSPQCRINRSLLNKLCCSHSKEHHEDFRKSSWAIYTKSHKIHDSKKENSTHSISPSDSPLVWKKPSFLRGHLWERRKAVTSHFVPLWITFSNKLLDQFPFCLINAHRGSLGCDSFSPKTESRLPGRFVFSLGSLCIFKN